MPRRILYSRGVRKTLIVIAMILAGCGGGGMENPGDDDAPPDAAEVPPDSPPPPDGYTRLLGRTWSLAAGQLDTYLCVRVTIPEDTYITSIIAQAPVGTHHTVVSIAGANGTAGPDGEYNCGVQSNGTQMLYASGVGTDPLDFPEGVGLKVSAGQQINLNLHLFNATDNAISGDSAILVKAQPTPPPTLAEMVFAGSLLFQLPPDPDPKDVRGGCIVDAPYTLFAVWPHMHQVATHQKVEIFRGNNPDDVDVIHDLDYTFAEQHYFLQSPEVQVAQGDRVQVTCTYVNDTDHTIRFGDSSNDEMCFAGLYRYPAVSSDLFDCTSL